MNPLQLLKAIYETVGTPHPRASLVAVIILGAISFGAVWLFAAKQVEKDRQASSVPVSAPASKPTSSSEKKKRQAPPRVEQHSSGANSPNVVTGDNGKVDINSKPEQ